MKTPIQELIEQLLRYKDKCERWADIKQEGCGQIYYSAMVEILNEIEFVLRSRYIDKERRAIEDAYFEGAKEWICEYKGDITDYDKEEAERYYNEKFKQ